MRPARGDIIAFSVPEYPDIVIIKRVIGLPGERVEQVDGIVYIDGQPLDEPYAVADRSGDGAWVVKSGHLFVEHRSHECCDVANSRSWSVCRAFLSHEDLSLDIDQGNLAHRIA